MKKLSQTLLAGTFLGGLAAISNPAAAAAICPASINPTCDLVFTFNANGSITTSGPGGSSIGGRTRSSVS